MSIKLLKLDRRYVNDVGDLLADSFIDNPLMLYFFPDESIRKKYSLSCTEVLLI